jgi:hypothetical protein
MHVISPREVVDVALFARDEESRRDCTRGSPTSSTAARVDVPSQVRPIRVLFELEQSRTNRGKKLTYGAAEPLGKDNDRNPDPRFVSQGIRRTVGFGRSRRSHKPPYPRAENLSDGSQQTLFTDDLCVSFVPIVETEHHHGEVGKVHNGSNAVTPEQLTWPQLADSSGDCNTHSNSARFTAVERRFPIGKNA